MLGRGQLTGSLFVALSLLAAGCGDMWGDLFGGKQGAGVLADGGTGPMCTRATHQQLLSSLNTSCTLSSQCPSGAFCDIDVGGFCNFQCEHSDDCPSDQVCNCLGQCVGDLPPDGGAAPDPACPRNLTLINQVTSTESGKRVCKFDDVCPYGTHCDDETGTCAAECTSDSECTGADGAVSICNCLGRCAAPGAVAPAPRTNAPSLAVTPGLIELPLPANGMIPTKPTFTPRDLDAHLQSSISKIINGGGIGGPGVGILVKAGKYLEVSCRVPCTGVNCETINYTAPAKECPLVIDESNWSPQGDGVATTQPVRVSASSEQPAQDEESAKLWTVTFQSADTAQTTSVVSLVYVKQAPAATALRDLITDPVSLQGGYTGYVELFVRDQTATFNAPNNTMHSYSVPVYAIGRGDTVYVYDPSLLLSATGVIDVKMATLPGEIISWVYSGPEIGTDALDIQINETVATSEFWQDPNSKALTGAFQIKNLMFNSHSTAYFAGRFMLKPDLMPSCDPADTTLGQIECPAGTGCVHGFCTNAVPNPPPASFGYFYNAQESDWIGDEQQNLLRFAVDEKSLSADNIMCQVGQFNAVGSQGIKIYRSGGPVDFIRSDVYKTSTLNGYLRLSGDAPCFTLSAALPGTAAIVGARAVPLLTNADSAAQKKYWVADEKVDKLNALGASELLSRCLSELQAKSPGVEYGATVPDGSNASLYLAMLGPTYFEQAVGTNSCVSLGNFYGAIEVARYQSDWPAYVMLLRQWLELHSFIGAQGLEEHQLNLVLQSANGGDQLGGDAPSSGTVNYEKILDVLESGMWFSVTNLGHVVTDLTTPQKVHDFDQSLVHPDYRNGNVPQSAANPQYEQTNGILPAMLEMVTAELRTATAFMKDANLRTYEESFNQFSPLRAKAIRRYGFAMRSALLAQNLAVNLHDRAVYACGHTVTPCTTLPWEERWKTAIEALRAARQEIVAQANRLVHVENPLGITESDVPIFFGDPVGTNSKYFASSDYLIDRWAAPAVQTSSNDLEQARQAWISQRNSKLQDELSTADRERRLEQIAEQYGRPIVQDCGFDVVDGAAVDGARAIDLITSGRATPGNCFIDPSCPGVENAWKPGELVNNAAQKANDLMVKFTSCIIDNTHIAPPRVPVVGTTQAQDTSDPEIEVTKSSFYPADVLCLTGNPNPIVLDTSGAEPVVRGTCSGTTYTMSFKKWYDFARPNGPEPADQLIRAQEICTEKYGYKPIPTPRIPQTCMRGRLGEAIAAGTTSSDGLSKALTDLSVLQQQMTAKAAFCLTLDQNESQRTRIATIVRRQLENAVQVSINAAATAQIGSLEGWITQIIVNEWDTVGQVIVTGTNVVGEVATGGARVVDWAYNKLSSLWGGDGGSVTQGWRGPHVQSVEDQKRRTLAYHSNGLATDFATQAEAVAAEGELRRAEADYQSFVDSQRAEEASGACWLEYHSMKIGLDSQLAIIYQSVSEVQHAAVTATNVVREIATLAKAGEAALDREKNRKWNGYAFHYWTEEKVDRFKRSFDWAQRLTFMAARAVEYEFQQSLPFRATVLSAHHPDQLAEVVRTLQQEQAGRTINRRRPEEASVVLSLRDDILRVADRSSAAEGERNWTPAARFKGRLRNTAYTVRDTNGNVLGQGVPFTVDPQAGAEASGVGLRSRCGERLWRVTATIQGDGLSAREPGAPVLLLQRNSFSSQYCAGHGDDMPMQAASIQPSRQLFRPDDQKNPVDQSREYTASQLYPWFNIRRSDFYKKSYQDGATEELAGRGLYSDYVLLFPQQLIDAGFPLEKVEDVLLRFDYLSVDNLAPLSPSN